MKYNTMTVLAAVIGCALAWQIPSPAAAQREKVVLSFGGRTAPYPVAGLIDVRGILYGTTEYSGDGNRSCGLKIGGCGILYWLDPKTGAGGWDAFCGASCGDGARPEAALIDVKGILYGTTYGGGIGTYKHCGKLGCGTVYAFDPATDAEKVIYSFCSQQKCRDGIGPVSNLIYARGLLYGTTQQGGIDDSNCYRGCGTVFVLDPYSGMETVLHSFCSRKRRNCLDGERPSAGLIRVKDKLYGTTSEGGDHNSGTVFSLDLKTGAEKVLHEFQGAPDGEAPLAGLVDVNGTLYGTTVLGGVGSSVCRKWGCGTVFSVDLTTGAESVVYSFCSLRDCADGSSPQAGLINVSGILYGTAGAVFSLNPTTGAETVVYAFCSRRDCKDGEDPVAGLIDVHGTLYGTTIYGGDQKGCYLPSDARLIPQMPARRPKTRCGTVFAIKHP
ncbi:MAG TPA: choice-of-anchor tandem repeat GloVer-containing protein [Rhizomicrobium sp.]|nr:choice-of-anchor tandem repeat GloVer-containing protein [Rhizomicrobium sp.]